LNCRENTAYKRLAKTGFLCYDVAATAALLRPDVEEMPCIIY